MLADEGIIGTCFKTIRLTLESLNVLRVYKEDEMIFGFSHLQELFIKIPDSVDLKSSYTQTVLDGLTTLHILTHLPQIRQIVCRTICTTVEDSQFAPKNMHLSFMDVIANPVSLSDIVHLFNTYEYCEEDEETAENRTTGEGRRKIKQTIYNLEKFVTNLDIDNAFYHHLSRMTSLQTLNLTVNNDTVYLLHASFIYNIVNLSITKIIISSAEIKYILGHMKMLKSFKLVASIMLGDRLLSLNNTNVRYESVRTLEIRCQEQVAPVLIAQLVYACNKLQSFIFDGQMDFTSDSTIQVNDLLDFCSMVYREKMGRYNATMAANECKQPPDSPMQVNDVGLQRSQKMEHKFDIVTFNENFMLHRTMRDGAETRSFSQSNVASQRMSFLNNDHLFSDSSSQSVEYPIITPVKRLATPKKMVSQHYDKIACIYNQSSSDEMADEAQYSLSACNSTNIGFSESDVELEIKHQEAHARRQQTNKIHSRPSQLAHQAQQIQRQNSILGNDIAERPNTMDLDTYQMGVNDGETINQQNVTDFYIQQARLSGSSEAEEEETTESEGVVDQRNMQTIHQNSQFYGMVARSKPNGVRKRQPLNVLFRNQPSNSIEAVRQQKIDTFNKDIKTLKQRTSKCMRARPQETSQQRINNEESIVSSDQNSNTEYRRQQRANWQAYQREKDEVVQIVKEWRKCRSMTSLTRAKKTEVTQNKDQIEIHNIYTNVMSKNDFSRQISNKMNVFYKDEDRLVTFQMLNELVNNNIIEREDGNKMTTQALARRYYRDNQNYQIFMPQDNVEFRLFQDFKLQQFYQLLERENNVEYFSSLQVFNQKEEDESFYTAQTLNVVEVENLFNRKYIAKQTDRFKEFVASQDAQATLMGDMVGNILNNDQFQYRELLGTGQSCQQHRLIIPSVLCLSLCDNIITLDIGDMALSGQDVDLLDGASIRQLRCQSINFGHAKWRESAIQELELLNAGLLDVERLAVQFPRLIILSLNQVILSSSATAMEMRLQILSISNSLHVVQEGLRNILNANYSTLTHLYLNNTHLPASGPNDRMLVSLTQLECKNIYAASPRPSEPYYPVSSTCVAFLAMQCGIPQLIKSSYSANARALGAPHQLPAGVLTRLGEIGAPVVQIKVECAEARRVLEQAITGAHVANIHLIE